VQSVLHGIANALFEGALVWVTYVAIEPIVRRRWPDLLFSWSRVLTGRFRDPLVGRDALAGIFGGTAAVVVLNLANGLPNWIDLRGMTPLPPSPLRILLGIPATLGRLFEAFNDGVVSGLVVMSVLVLAVIVVRRRWLAAAFVTLLLTAFALGGENYAVEVPMGLLLAAIGITVAARFGILALCFSYFANSVLTGAPLTLDFSRWYAGRGLFLAGVVVALAVWAFRVAIGGKSAFSGTGLGEA
jgi:hypothetical protein